jgi:predicted MFS family arabinose efflux permease
MPHNPTPHPQERWILWVLAGIQFSHIVDFMIMMPLGPQITQQFGIGDAAFGFLVSSYTWAAAISGLVALCQFGGCAHRHGLVWRCAVGPGANHGRRVDPV